MATVTTKFFNPNMTAAEMKAEYRKLVLKYHPDMNGGVDNQEIRFVTAEYAYWYARASSSEVYERKTAENPDKTEYYSKYTSQAYIDSLEAMINWLYSENIDRIAGIEVELVGVFIWIGGIKADMKEVQFKIKSVGFQGSFKRFDDGSSAYMWKWTPEIRRFGSQDNYNEIQRKYGTQDVKRKGAANSNSRKQIGS